jgi:hypothetical protein
MAAVAWFGLGMWWHHARLRWPVPWALAELTSVPRRCCRKGHLAPLGIGVTLAVLRLAVTIGFILGGLTTRHLPAAGSSPRLRPPAPGAPTFFVYGLIMAFSWTALWLTSLYWELQTAAARGPLRPGVDAPLRRRTDLAMRPAMAAVAWSGFGMR